MTDREYAGVIYCQVFNVIDDDGDAHVPGIEAAMSKLSDRERIALESYYRYNNTYAKTAEIISNIKKDAARTIVTKAILKLRHPYYSNKMRVSKLESLSDFRLGVESFQGDRF
ncbi:MAG: hypothetical protein FWC13_02330 [Oscillospiraceae bacterium]|nr:hypothetical protein [Oscillospiraceae bacterium]